jgi:hypothetical protein
MEAYGIIVTGFTLFGMLGLLIASLTMEDSTAGSVSSHSPVEAAAADTEFNKAA